MLFHFIHFMFSLWPCSMFDHYTDLKTIQAYVSWLPQIQQVQVLKHKIQPDIDNVYQYMAWLLLIRPCSEILSWNMYCELVPISM